jgi:peptide deformylase
MEQNKQKDLLQPEIPSNTWLIKDTDKKIIRSISLDVENPQKLTVQELKTISELIDFVRYSQDPELNQEENPDHLRPAVGLAAPQIGVNKNMFYMRIEWPNEEDGKQEEVTIEEYAMINAKIIARAKQITALENGEGCLSVDDDRSGIVPRAYKIMVEGYDFIQQKNLQMTLRGYTAIVFQHELDHINGHLYYDHINENEPFYVGEDWILI